MSTYEPQACAIVYSVTDRFRYLICNLKEYAWDLGQEYPWLTSRRVVTVADAL